MVRRVLEFLYPHFLLASFSELERVGTLYWNSFQDWNEINDLFSILLNLEEKVFGKIILENTRDNWDLFLASEDSKNKTMWRRTPGVARYLLL